MQLRAVIACVGLLAGTLVALSGTTAQAAPTRYEAETSPAICTGTIDSDWAGYSGSGFCNGTNAVGAVRPVHRERLRGGHGDAERPFRQRHHHRPARRASSSTARRSTSPSFEGTGAWSTWVTKTLTVPVNAGSNTIRLNPTTATGLPNIDYLDVEVPDGDTTPPPSRHRAVRGAERHATARPARSPPRPRSPRRSPASPPAARSTCAAGPTTYSHDGHHRGRATTAPRAPARPCPPTRARPRC